MTLNESRKPIHWAHDIPQGTIIETMYRGITGEWIPSGNIYIVAGYSAFPGRVKCRTQFTSDIAYVWGENRCRVLDPNLIDGF